jgi:hypothetical protein
MKEFSYSVDSDFDYTIDEKGNTFIALRKIDWGNKGDYKLDLRKYYASESGETMQKGVSFLTEDGPNELTKILLETGYGDANEITDTIVYKRPDILGRICKIIASDPSLSDPELLKEFDDDEEYYDPEELIG